MIWVGTSGYNYPEWKGSFYPSDLPAAKMLPYYAARFPTVEINYTFYRMPSEKTVAGWAAQTPSPYKLTLKAPRRITHDSRLRDCDDLGRALLPCRRHARGQARNAAVSASALRKKGPGRARRLSRDSAATVCEAPSSSDIPHGLTTRCFAPVRQEPCAVRRRQREDVDARLASPPITRTSACVTKAIPTDDIVRWADTIERETASCRDVFVYFKHEEQGKGPARSPDC